jgi:ABC-type spermidine/putrescine transport system permease subunit II
MMRTGLEKTVYWSCAGLFGLTVVILYSPILATFLFSLVPLNLGKLEWSEAGFQAYHDLLANADMTQSLRDSILVAVSASLIASVFAVLMALYVDSRHAIGKRYIEALIYLPFIMPSMITGLALLLYFSALSIPMSLATVMVGHTIVVVYFIYRLSIVRLANHSPSLLEATLDLGGTEWQTFRYVVLPHLKPAILSGVLFACAISIDETLITLFLSGDRMTLPISLWSMLRIGLTQQIYALVTLVILGTTVIALLGIRSLRLGDKQDS